jgi:hypothetical protein
MDGLDLINIICPEHDRTSCDDNYLYNRFAPRSRSRCSRCTLLAINKGIIKKDDFNCNAILFIGDN